MNQSTVYGWTMHQWSLAAGRYGIDEIKTPAEAIELIERWEQENHAAPGEIVLEGVDYPISPRVGLDVFMLCSPTRTP